MGFGRKRGGGSGHGDTLFLLTPPSSAARSIQPVGLLRRARSARGSGWRPRGRLLDRQTAVGPPHRRSDAVDPCRRSRRTSRQRFRLRRDSAIVRDGFPAFRPRSFPAERRVYRCAGTPQFPGPRRPRGPARFPPLLGQRTPQPAQRRLDLAGGADRPSRGRVEEHPGRQRRHHAAESRAVAHRRGVPRVGGAAPGPHRPRPGPCARLGRPRLAGPARLAHRPGRR